MSNEGFGRRVRLVRSHRGWSQARLGTALHCNQSKICNLEHGTCSLYADEFGRMAEALHFSMDVFYRSDPFDITRCMLPWPDERDKAE